MLIPLKEHSEVLEVKKSRFYGSIAPVESAEAAMAVVEEARREYPAANHHCWAYRLQSQGALLCRFSDAGEPSGTAGKPIWESLAERDIVDAVLVVSRIFGGIKLGMGGLSRAYRECARAVIAGASFREKVEMCGVKLVFGYAQETRMRNLLSGLGGSIVSSEYGEKVRWEVSVPKETKEEFLVRCRDICGGEAGIRCIDTLG